MEQLDQELERAFDKLKVENKHRLSILRNLDIIRNVDETTYEHCVVVGLASAKAGSVLLLDAKGLLFPGLMHDRGKAELEPYLLRIKGKPTAEEMEMIKKHVQYTYDLLKEVHPFSAEVGLRHHMFQKHPYPTVLPEKMCAPFTPATQAKIYAYARIISAVDYCHAFITRDNARNGLHGMQELNAALVRDKPGSAQLVQRLLTLGVVGAIGTAQMYNLF